MRRYSGEQPFFEQAGCCPVRLEVRGGDHQPVRWPVRSRQRAEYSVEHAHSAPAYEAVIQRLRRAVRARRVFPWQAVLDDVNDPADHAQIVHARNAVRQGNVRGDAGKLLLRQQEPFTHGGTSHHK